MTDKQYISPHSACETPGRHQRNRGLLITFEGADSAGKTTHATFLAEMLRAYGEDVIYVREPGGTRIGEMLRSIVLDPANDMLSNETELLLYEAARSQLVAELIEPALARGSVVLCDRFTDSTVAYQGFGRGLARDLIERLNEFACRGVYPDRTILLTGTNDRYGLLGTNQHADRLEQAGDAFYARVSKGFDELACNDSHRIRVVVCAQRRVDTARAVLHELTDLFAWIESVLNDDAAFVALEQHDAQEAQICG